MKFGDHLNQQRIGFPAHWQSHFISYDALKGFLKHQMVDTSVRLSTAFPPTHVFEWDSSFDQLLAQRLSRLHQLTPQFIRMLDTEVSKLNAFYVEIRDQVQTNLTRVLENGKALSECESALGDLLQLEKFVYLNFTAVAKALKKHDKWSGLSIREPYLMRTSQLDFVASTSLLKLKPKLLDRITQLSSGSGSGSGKQALRSNALDRSAMASSGVGLDLPRASDKSCSPKLSPLVELLYETQTVMISLRGPHGTDIIGGVLRCLAGQNCEIVDFSLSRLHHDVTFGVLVHLHDRGGVDLFSDLAKTAQRWDATLHFDAQDARLKASRLQNSAQYGLEEAPYASRVKYMATVMNEDGLTPEFLDQWLGWLLEKKISVEQMRRLDRTGRSALLCVEFKLSVPDTLALDEFRAELIAISTSHHTDVAFQPDNVFRRQKRLVVFDMDSTLIQQEVIDEIARATGIEREVAAITESAMQGEIDFKESLARRVVLLEGTPVRALEEVKQSLTFTEGAHYLCRALKSAGFKLAVISGGFLPLAKYVKAELGLDYAFANQLQVSPDGTHLTGQTVGPVVDGSRKAELLEVIAQAEGIDINQVVAVGDGANDLLMLGKASLGIAFNAKPRVQQQAGARINQKSLANILYLMGYSENEAAELQLFY